MSCFRSSRYIYLLAWAGLLALLFPTWPAHAECTAEVSRAEALLQEGILNYSESVSILIEAGKGAYSQRDRVCLDDVRLVLARFYLQGADYRKALKLLTAIQKADRLSRQDPEINNLIGVAYFYEEMYTEAAFHFKRALLYDPKMKVALFNLKSINRRMLHLNAARAYQKAKEYDRAVKEYRDLLWISQNFVNGRYRLGLLYREMGLLNDSLKELKRAYNINPRHRQAHMILKSIGDIYAEKGDLIGAVESYSAAVSLNPNYTEALRELEKYRFTE